MKAFFDIEYVPKKTPIFASIGIVRDDGAELHMVSSEFDPERGGWFFLKRVWPSMAHEPRYPVAEIVEAVRDMLRGVTLIATRDGGRDREFLEQLIGPLAVHYCDLEKVWHGFGRPMLPCREQSRHDALEDARWHRTLFDHVFQPVLRAA